MPKIKVLLLAETLFVLGVLLLSLHFLALRIDTRSLPQGDEGSWMAAAAELSRGNGFSTRWLEHGFLRPYTLPRPDDYRYPGLVVILAVVFALAGAGYTAALWTVASLFLIFCTTCYILFRNLYGRRTALATLPLICFSLLQLMYATEVYTEGLFGIGLALLLSVSIRFQPLERVWWYLTGATTGLLYLIRPNAILFALALVLFAAWLLYRKKVRWSWVAGSVLTMIAVMAPWLIRSWVHFGNPFHLAGSAGLLRAQPSDVLTATLPEFIGRYGFLYFLQAPFQNAATFFRLLHEQEHGLELLPLAFCVLGLFRLRVLVNGYLTLGVVVSLFACFYTSAMGNWAGVRYFSPFLPFVYAYGIHQFFSLTDRMAARLAPRARPLLRYAGCALLIAILIAPIYHPHRYYERHYAKAAKGNRDYSSYYAALAGHLGSNRCYYAGSLAQINFATTFNCIGMQFYFDSTELRRAQKAFNPALMALTPRERQAPYFIGLMETLAADGYCLTESVMPDSFAVFVHIGR